MRCLNSCGLRAAGAAPLASRGSAATALGDDLGESWRQCVALAQQQVPDPAERRDPRNPANWLVDTEGDVRRISLLPDRAQKTLSTLVMRMESGELLRSMAATDAGGDWSQLARRSSRSTARYLHFGVPKPECPVTLLPYPTTKPTW